MKQSCCNRKPLYNHIFKIIVIAIIAIVILHTLYEESSLFYRKYLELPFSMHLNEREVYMIRGEEFRLFVFGGINKRISFASTDFRVVGVNFNGRLYAYRTGKAFIVAKVDDKELKCRVYVIDINKEKITLKAGETYRLKIRGSNAYVRWKSTDEDTAKVGMFGKVTAVNRGTAIITAEIKGKTLKCTVIVE